MRKITIVLLSSLLIIALGACKNATPQVENGKPALMWFDAEANFERFSNPDSIDYYLTKIKSLGFTHAIVDVRPITGEVLFDTEFAPKMREWHGYERKDFDYLGHFIKKAHELGIEVHRQYTLRKESLPSPTKRRNIRQWLILSMKSFRHIY